MHPIKLVDAGRANEEKLKLKRNSEQSDQQQRIEWRRVCVYFQLVIIFCLNRCV